MVKVLFVCMGNICRSPSAEGVFYNLLAENGLENIIYVDSAGTHGYHTGEQADKRAVKAAFKRGVDIRQHRARMIDRDDFEKWDYILAMDNDNYDRLIRQCPLEHSQKVKMFLEFASKLDEMEVPDPYYGGDEGFEYVLDLLEVAAKGLLKDIELNHSIKFPKN